MSGNPEEMVSGLEHFLREYRGEMLLISTGAKSSPDTFSIFQRHSHLFDVFSISNLGDSLSRETGDGRRRMCLIQRFLQRNYPQAMVSDHSDLFQEKGAAAFRTCGPPLRAMEDVFRASMEPNRGSRSEDWKLRNKMLRDLNPILEKRQSGLHEASMELGYGGLAELSLDVRGLDMRWLTETLDTILDRTEPIYLEMLDTFLEPMAISLDEVERHDVLHLLCGREFDAMFPSQRIWNSLSRAASGMGAALGASESIRLRNLGCGTAHFLPVEVPGEIYLFIEPNGGFVDYMRHFEEAGRAMQMGSISPEIPVEYRNLGYPVIQESSALLMQSIISTRSWLCARGDSTTVARFRRLFHLYRIYEIRRLASLLLFEMRMSTSSLTSIKNLHNSIMEENMHFPYRDEDFLLEIISPFSSADRIQGFIFEAMLRKALLEKAGEGWCSHPSTRETLKEIWLHGGRYGLPKLANYIGYAELNPEPLVEEIEDLAHLV